MSKDRLFLIISDFEDPKFPGKRFFCPHCNAIEGLLAANPQYAGQIEVIRVWLASAPEERYPVSAAISGA